MDGFKGKRPLPLWPLTLPSFLAATLTIVGRIPLWACAVFVLFLLLALGWYARRQRLGTLLPLLAFKPRSISAVTPAEMEIELSRLAREKIEPGKHFPPYIHRKQEDDRIRSRLKQHRFVIVAGNRYAGKTRAALEAIRSGRKGRVLLVRRSVNGDNPLRELLSQPWLIPQRSRCFVFVDKLNTYLDGLDPHDVEAWLEARPHAALVATISHKAKNDSLDETSGAFERNRQILSESRIARIKGTIGGSVLQRAQEEYGEDPELAYIGSYLGGGQVIEDRYAYASSERPAAWAIATAAVTAVRAGISRGLSEGELVELAKKLGLLDRFTADEEIEDAIDFCTHESEGILGLLTLEERSQGERRLRANSMLVRAVSEAGGGGPAPLALTTWEKLADSLARDQRSCVELARGAWVQAVDRDAHDRALIELALEVLWSDAAKLGRDTEIGKIAIELEAAILKELDTEGARRSPKPPYAPPVPLPKPNPDQVQEVIDRRGVTGDNSLFEPELPAYWNPPAFYTNRAKRDVLRSTLLVSLDLVGLMAGIAAGVWLFHQLVGGSEQTQSITRGGAIAVPLLLVLFAYLGLYRPDSKRAKLAEIVNGMAIAAFVLAVVALVQGFETSILPLILFAGIGAAVVVFYTRAFYDWGSAKWVERRGLRARTLFVAPVETAHLSADLIHQTSRRPMQFVGFVSEVEAEDAAQLSTLAEFEKVLEEFFVDHVILADPDLSPQRRSELTTVCHTRGVRLELLPSTDEVFQDAVEALPDLSVPLIEIPRPHLSPISARIKRSFDFLVGAVLSCLVGLPLALVLTPIVWLLNGFRSPLGRVPRLGRKERGFSMYRFHLGPDNPLAGWGNNALRRTQLHKLPQLLNVLRGEMSLVGPRPLNGPEFSQLSEVERHRYAMKPGITGLWQVSLRNVQPRDEFAPMALMGSLDLIYCRRWSPLLDFTIILRTPWAIIRGAASEQEEEQDEA